MAIRELFQEIASAWPNYRERRTVDKTDAVHQLVTHDGPLAIKAALGQSSHNKVEGSDGAGNITAAPWIGIFDPRVTTSATNGYYVVYLFSVDLSTIVLAIAFGTTQFEKQFGGPQKAFPRMREAAARLHDLYRRTVPERYLRQPIRLNASPGNKLHFAYEQSAIFSLPPYSLASLPTEAVLAADLKEIVGLYQTIVEDPLKPDIDILLQAAIPAAKTISDIEVRDFQTRPPLKLGPKGGGKGMPRRYSPQSRKVGDAGERAVLEHEKEKLNKCGRSDLVSQIRHHAAEGEFPGWDITSFDNNGQEIYIEVKASIGSLVSSVDLTANEWAAASLEPNRNRYFIYIVTNALSERPSIEKLRNPHVYVSSGELAIQPFVYQLSFRGHRN